MGKIKGFIQEFLDDGGNDLGYGMSSDLPKLKDMNRILKKQIPVWKYLGYESEDAYYLSSQQLDEDVDALIQDYMIENNVDWSDTSTPIDSAFFTFNKKEMEN